MPEVLAQEPASGNPNVGTDTSLKKRTSPGRPFNQLVQCANQTVTYGESLPCLLAA